MYSQITEIVAAATAFASRTPRVYVLHPTASGWSPNTVEYRGTSVTVAAVSIRQAYFLASKGQAATVAEPFGIVATYSREHGAHRAPCGCVVTRVPEHGSGVRAIRAALAEHVCTNR